MQSFSVAMKGFFGYRAGQGMADFQKELQALTYDDKLYFHKELAKVGVDCLPPIEPTK